MALKRVCDITGTDRDVEICDVTIAGQTIKLDLSPAGADRLREFFGSVVIVRHPQTDSSPNGPVSVSAGSAEDSDNDEFAEAEIEIASVDEEDDEEEEQVPAMVGALMERESAALPERPARRGRRPASVRKKAVARRTAKPTAQSQATAEIREWARANGFEVGERGAIPGRIRSAYTLAHE